MGSKGKGTRLERELFHMFWENSWGSIRVAGSGSTSLPAPDLLVGNSKRFLAIECKAGKEKRYIRRGQVEELVEFSTKFGAEPWIAVRFNNMGWYFLGVDKLQDTKGGNFVVDKEFCKLNGITFEDFIKG